MIKSVTSLLVKAIYHISWHRDDIPGFLSAHFVLAGRYTAELTRGIRKQYQNQLTIDPSGGYNEPKNRTSYKKIW